MDIDGRQNACSGRGKVGDGETDAIAKGKVSEALREDADVCQIVRIRIEIQR